MNASFEITTKRYEAALEGNKTNWELFGKGGLFKSTNKDIIVFYFYLTVTPGRDSPHSKIQKFGIKIRVLWDIFWTLGLWLHRAPEHTILDSPNPDIFDIPRGPDSSFVFLSSVVSPFPLTLPLQSTLLTPKFTSGLMEKREGIRGLQINFSCDL